MCVENKPSISCEKIKETSTTESTATTDVESSTMEPTDACSDFQCPVEQSCVLELQCVQTSIGSGNLKISFGSGSGFRDGLGSGSGSGLRNGFGSGSGSGHRNNGFGSGSGYGFGITCKDFVVCPRGSECKLQPNCSPATKISHSV